MQTYIKNILTVVRNISGIDEAVYSNIYDIEQTDKTVFVIIPGDITDNFTAYLVNGSIQLMSKVMLVLKSKYIETNMVITSKDNIKEFSLDNCSGVYNVIKFKLIYRREDCGDSYEGMFVKSINGLHGEVFLDIPEKVSDLIQDIDYATEEYVNERISEIEEDQVKSVNGQKGDVQLDIPEKVSDLVQDVNYITEEDADEKYMQKGDVPTDVYTKSEIDNKFVDSSKYTDDTYAKKSSLDNFYTKSDIDGKVYSIDSSIKDVENKIPDVKDFATRDELNSSIANVSSWVSDNYMKKGEAPTDTYTKKEVDDKDADVLTQTKGYTEQKVQDLSNYIDQTFATKEEIPTDYVNTEDYNKFVSDQGTIDETQNEAIAANTQDIADINTNITNVEADVKEIEDLLYSVNNVIKSNIPDTLSLDIDTKKLPENIQGLIDYKNQVIDDTYVRKEDIPDIPDYTNKFNDINSSISDVSVRIKAIEDDYLKNSDKTELEGKISTVDSNYKAADEALDNKIGANTEEINNVSGRVKTIEDSYVKSSDYNEKVSDIDSSISDVSSRLKNVKDVVDSIPENYQEKLVSGTNIKKINGEDILGEGNIIIQGGGSSSNHVNITLAEWEALSPEEKLADIVYFITDAENEYAKASDVQTVSDKVSNIEADYVKHEELPIVPDYTDKFNEIDTNIGVLQSGVQTNTNNISNLDSKTNNIDSNYKAADEALDNKIGANTEEINNVSGRVSTIEADYVKSDDIKDFITQEQLPDYNPKFTEINSSISDVSNRIKTIENDYLTSKDKITDYVKQADYNTKVSEINSSIYDVSNRVKNIENDYLTSKDKITDYVKQSDYNTKVSEINSSIYDVSARIKNIEDVGLATRMAVDMSNINAAGEQKVKDIIRTEGYITEIPDSYATKEELNSSLANVSSWVSDNYAKKTSLDSYLLKTDAQNTYATTGQVSGLNDRVNELDQHITDVYTYYNPKLTEINSSISDVSSRLAGIVIPTDYVHTDTYEANLQEQENVNTNVSQKLDTIDSSVNNLDQSVSQHSLDIQGIKGNIDVINSNIDNLGGRINTLENANYATEDYVNGQISDLHISDYLKSSDATNIYLKIEDLPDYSSKFNDIDSSISNVSTRVKTVENKFDDYVLSSYIEGRISDISSAISSGDYDTLTDANRYTDDEIKKLPNYSVKISEIDSSISDVSSRINTLEKSNFLTKTLADTYYVHSSDYNTDKAAQEQTNNTLSQDIIRLDGYFVKTNTSIGILNTSVNLLETNKLENLTPGTIVKIEGGMDLQFIADLTDADSNKARAIQLNEGETYYYELISGSGHAIWLVEDVETPSVKLDKSTKFTWNKSSFNTGSGDTEEMNDVILQINGNSNSVGKLYKYLGEHPSSETTLENYIYSKIDSKIGDINTILESI